MRRSTETIGFTRSRHGLRISAGPTRYSCRRRPLPLLKKTGSSSRDLGFRYRVRDRSNRSKFDPRLPPMEFPAPSATPTQKIHYRRAFQNSSNGPPSAFHTLSTVYTLLCLASLFHLAAAHGISFPRTSPTAKPELAHHQPIPSCR
jgi:hypothetical protein